LKIYNCNEVKLNNQKEYLKKEIWDGYNQNIFKVLDHECGTGKSRTVEEAFAEYETTEFACYNFKVLFVRERIEDCINSAKRINELAGKTIAIAVNTKTYNTKEFNKIKKTLKDFRIVIITHEKYKSLCTDKENKKYFEEKRDTLVIDEFLNMCKGNELTINQKWISNIETMLGHRTLRNQFVDCVAEIEDYLLSEKPIQSFFNAKIPLKTITTRINALKKSIKNALTKEYLNEQGYTKRQLIEDIENIKQFYIQTCVCEGNTIYCTNRRYQYWFLSMNNIILDASATLNMAYKLSPNFVVQHQSPVLDHSKWSFLIYKTNSCKSAKERAINYYQELNKIVEQNNIDNTLVIGNKEDEAFTKANYKNHFGNITGSNDYKQLTNCVITHNPNMPFRQYVLEYLYYSNKKLDNRNSWSGLNNGKGDEKVYRFKEDKFEEYRQCKNANEIYQAIKRVNRTMEKESKIYIFNNDSETIDRVLKMFKGNKKVAEYENFIEFGKTDMDKYNEERQENRHAMKFITLCKEIIQLRHIDLQATKKNRKGEEEQLIGTYKKSTLRECLGIKDKGQFKRDILDDVDVIGFCARHSIKLSGQTLDFNNAKLVV
jgi:hypothetical protein